ncbi:MAG: nickel pincer cofactor biosynthesis protein LarB [Methanolinea sp.]|nr:nickel pincer cofactor biosynthesis protein LarB [Methanolinea sp.]
MASKHRLREVLQGLKEGRITLDEAARMIDGLWIEEVEGMARLDLGRTTRCGIPEVILAEGKSPSQLAGIVRRATELGQRTIVSRLGPEHARVIQEICDEETIPVIWHEKAGMAVIACSPGTPPGNGIVAIITAGTSDQKVAEEARVIAEEMGCSVRTAYDLGAAGIHRLFPALKRCLDAHVFVVAAGREGTLPAVVAGLVDRPVIGVPVSTGYGYMGEGRAALASMLQSCAVIAVVNIDAGFVAGAFAARIASMVGER